METWIATAKTTEIEELAWAPVAGVITNPTVLLQAGPDWRETIRTLASYRPLQPASLERVHLQSIAVEHREILKEMEEYAQLLAPKLLIPKVPMTSGGMAAARDLVERGYRVNITALCSLPQVEIALNAGASYVSMYVARINDTSESGTAGYQLIEWTREYIDRNGLEAKIMAASVRNVEQYGEVIRRGAHAVAAPPQLIRSALFDELTDKSLQAFAEEWKKAVS